MAKVNVSLSLPDEVLQQLKREASDQKKSLGEVVSECLQNKNIQSSDQNVKGEPVEVNETNRLLVHLLDRFYQFEANILGSNMAIGELSMRAVRASAQAVFWARLATSFNQDITSYLTAGRAPEAPVKKCQLDGMEACAVAFGKYYLAIPYDQLIHDPVIVGTFEEKRAIEQEKHAAQTLKAS